MLYCVQFTLIHGPNIPGSYAILFFTALDFTFITRLQPQQSITLLHPSHFIVSRAISNCPLLFPSSILEPFRPAVAHLLMLYLFAFSHCSWDSQGKNMRVVCHSLLQWNTFCQNSPLWPIHLGLPCTAMLIASLNYASSLAKQGFDPWRQVLAI